MVGRPITPIQWLGIVLGSGAFLFLVLLGLGPIPTVVRMAIFYGVWACIAYNCYKGFRNIIKR
ncbi:hypothetical protein LCGC14_2787550 [marine sediment metagenome]|uniref:Uncharacterized protein n=1 Tax=marine sediment metagenome TaxID=412755 RepID=A0A0F8ZDK3_9ZZZZ